MQEAQKALTCIDIAYSRLRGIKHLFGSSSAPVAHRPLYGQLGDRMIRRKNGARAETFHHHKTPDALFPGKFQVKIIMI